MSSPPRNPNAPTLGTLVDFARRTIGATTGLSPNIGDAHASIHANFHDLPLTRANVNRLVNAENFHAVHGLHNTRQDTVAFLFTPFRRVAAHVAARGLHAWHGTSEDS
jgi:hypothetical protein